MNRVIIQMYHGTSVDNGKKIIKTQQMNKSQGDEQWLGEGIYLYESEFLAFRWIDIKFRKEYVGLDKKENLFKKYMILQVDIECDPKRIFSFTNPENSMEFTRVKKRYMEFAQKTKRINGRGVYDGVILNIMFNDLGYNKYYDIVRGFFPYKGNITMTHSRICNLGEEQICVKNEKCVKKISDCTDPNKYDEYRTTLQEFNTYRTYNAKPQREGIFFYSS